ncbi:MAG: tetratricopeptide repeat protein [Nitrospirae bacterium]|nr:tetratricopeptide repeat protein [Nitrospirota bacterium]
MKKSLSLILVTLCFFCFSRHASADYASGLTAYSKHDYQECLNQLEAYTNRTPDTGAYYLMGYASYKLGNYKEAKEYFRKAYLLDPNFRPASLGVKQPGH